MTSQGGATEPPSNGEEGRSPTLPEFLVTFAGARLLHLRDDEPTMTSGAHLVFTTGRQVILLEKLYRGRVYLLADPTSEELAILRDGDLFRLLNAERACLVGGLVF